MALKVWVLWFRPALRGGEQIFLGGIGVAGAGNGAIFAEGLDQHIGARQLGRKGHLGDEGAVFQNGPPLLGGWVSAIIGVLRAGAGFVDEWPLDVYADNARAAE